MDIEKLEGIELVLSVSGGKIVVIQDAPNAFHLVSTNFDETVSVGLTALELTTLGCALAAIGEDGNA